MHNNESNEQFLTIILVIATSKNSILEIVIIPALYISAYFYLIN